MALVEFNGALSLVLVHDGETELDVQQDLYSDWKEWAGSGTNLRFLAAFRTVGGDPITVDRDLGDSYFITNGWLIRPYSADHELVCTGNLFAEQGADIFTPATGSVTVTAIVERAIDTFRDTTTIQVSGTIAGLLPAEAAQLDDLYRVHGLETGTPLIVSDTQRSAGAGLIQDITENDPATGSVTARRQ